MKIAAVVGSPHGLKGSTGQLVHAVLEAAQKGGAAVTTLSLGDLTVGPCQACDACHRTGQCAVTDDFETVRRALLRADGIVLASPNYMSSVTGQMKSAMDRCCGPMHLQALEGKHGAAVVTSGGAGSAEVEAYLLRFLRAMGCWTVGSLGIEAWKLDSDAEKPRILDAAAKLGAGLVRAIADKATFPDQETERHASRERMRALVEMRKDAWPFEYQQWQARGRA